MPRKTLRSALQLRKVAHKRTTYTERTGQLSRAAQTLISAANGHEHWTHDEIRTALLRQCAVEIEDLLEELPRPAILHAVSKGWIHRAAGQAWFRVTKRAANELRLPAKTGAGQTIRFIDTKSLPASLPAFEEPKPIVVSEARIAALLAAISEPRDVLAQARFYQAMLTETGWAPVEIARRIHPDDRKAMGKVWDDVIWHINVLALEPVYQAAVGAGQLTIRDASELHRVPAAHRPTLFAAFQAGKSRSAVRQLANQLTA